MCRWGELAARWTKFAGISIPWLTRLVTAVLRGRLEQEQVQLAKDAVRNFERLGATYIKVGQVLSVRYLPPSSRQTCDLVMMMMSRLLPLVNRRCVVKTCTEQRDPPMLQAGCLTIAGHGAAGVPPGQHHTL